MNTQISTQLPFRDWPAESWPVNEIKLQSLVQAGRTDTEIARMFGIDAETVAALRGEFGL